MTPRIRGFASFLMGFLVLAPACAADRPGQHFEISPSDLPPPHATPAVDNSASVVPRPAGALPEAPQGFTVSLFASGLTQETAGRSSLLMSA